MHLVNNTTAPATVTAISAVLDADAPAKLYKPRRRYDKVRTPDFVDYATGESVWLTDAGVVTVPVMRLRAFHAYMACGGLTIVKPGTYTMRLTEDLSWDNLKRIVEG